MTECAPDEAAVKYTLTMSDVCARFFLSVRQDWRTEKTSIDFTHALINSRYMRKITHYSL